MIPYLKKLSLIFKFFILIYKYIYQFLKAKLFRFDFITKPINIVDLLGHDCFEGRRAPALAPPCRTVSWEKTP